MKVIALANTILFKNAISGGDVVFPQINRFLDRKDYDVIVVTNSVGMGLFKNLKSEAEIQVIPDTLFDRLELFSFVPALYAMRMFFVIFKLEGILKASAGEKTVIYTCSDFFCDTIPALLFKSFNKNVKWVARVYHIVWPPHKRKGNAIFNIISFAAQRFSFLIMSIGADAVLTLSGTIKELKKLLFRGTDIRLNDPGLDLEAIEAAKRYDREFDAVYVGGLIPTKGIYELLEIWRKVTREIPNAKLAIVGGGSKRDIEVYGEKIRKYSIESNVEYVGFLPKNEDVYGVMKASKVFVYTGHENGWCLPASEAFACRVPCVAYKLKLFGTAFHKGFITVNIHDYEAFAKEVIGILKNENKRSGIAQDAYDEAKQLDWKNVARRFSEVLYKVVLP